MGLVNVPRISIGGFGFKESESDAMRFKKGMDNTICVSVVLHMVILQINDK